METIMRRDVDPRHRQFAKSMRVDATKAERMLWQQLRGKRMGGLRFRRQVPLDGYILDLVCFEARLIIEADGWQHAESRSDAIRDSHFQNEGFTTLRFSNEEIIENLDEVCRKITDCLQRQTPALAKSEG
jgi:very-short-patch-repair endonuclease